MTAAECPNVSSSDKSLTLSWLDRRLTLLDGDNSSVELPHESRNPAPGLRPCAAAAARPIAADFDASYDIRFLNASRACCRRSSSIEGMYGRCGDRDAVRRGVESTTALDDRYMLLAPAIDDRASVSLETTSD